MPNRSHLAIAAVLSLLFPSLQVAFGRQGPPSRRGAHGLAWLCAWFSQFTLVMAAVTGICVLLGASSIAHGDILVGTVVLVGVGGVAGFMSVLAQRVGALVPPLLHGRWAELRTRTRTALRGSMLGVLLAAASCFALGLPFPGRWDSTVLLVLVILPTVASAVLAPLVVLPVWLRGRQRST